MARRILLGLGNSVDYEVRWDPAVLERLALEHRVGPDEIDRRRPIRGERDLVASILGYLRDGLGDERNTGGSCDLRGFAARFGYAVTLGGTNVRAAVALDKLGIRSTLHVVSAGAEFRRLVPKGVRWVCGAPDGAVEPHLIVQFAAGDAVTIEGVTVRAPRSNRLIVADDELNRTLPLSPALGDELARTDLVVVSGFNAMDDRALLDKRLGELEVQLTRLPDGALVVYEHAGFHDPGLGRVVLDRIAARADVVSLNEDELQRELDREVALDDPADVRAALGEIRDAVDVPALVVHTAGWVAAVGARAKDVADGLEGGSAVAAARYAWGDRYTADDVHGLLSRAERDPAGVAVARHLNGGSDQTLGVAAFRLAVPVPTTVGLGDAFVGGFVAGLVGGLRGPAARDRRGRRAHP